MSATDSTRRYMTERASIGSRWRRRRDGSTWRIKSVWRKDRLALLEREGSSVGERVLATFDVLRDRWEEA